MYEMKKTAAILLICFLLLTCFSLNCSAFNENENEIISESGADELFDELDDETKELLNELGIYESSTEEILEVSPERLVKELIKIIGLKMNGPMKLFMSLLIIMICESVTKSISNEKQSSFSDAIFIILITTASASHAINIINLSASHLMTCGSFMISFIPVYAFMISSSGSVTQALNFDTLLFSASELIITFSQKILLPVSGILISLNISSSVNPVLKTESLISSVKKTITVVITFISTLFIGFLSFRGSVASSVDALTVRSIRTVSGAVIPFIGSTLADSYASFLGSIQLIKNSFGFLGILIICAITMPVIVELLFYYFAFNFAGVCGKMLNCESSKITEGLAGIISIINTILVFSSLIFVISIGIMLKTRVS